MRRTEANPRPQLFASSGDPEVPALIIAYCFSEPARVGEVALFPKLHAHAVLGRGLGSGAEARVAFVRQRPGEFTRTAPLNDETLSRRQLVITARPFGFEVENVGKADLLVNGEPASLHLVPFGGTIQVAGSLVLYCSSRPAQVPAGEFVGSMGPLGRGAFGEADKFGIVGESLAIWDLLDDLTRAATGSEGHVLLRGPKGTEKERAARAVHGLGVRHQGPFLSHRRAALLGFAELFGTAKDPPSRSSGMDGLVNQAHGGTLFIDEITDLKANVLAGLLELMDDGTAHKGRDDRSTRSDVRIVAATSRSLGSPELSPLARRFAHHVLLPPLEARPEDIPLLVRHLVLGTADRTGSQRFVTKSAHGRLEAKVDADLVDALLRREYPNQVTELKEILAAAASTSRRTTLRAYPELIERSSRHLPIGVAASLDEEESRVAALGEDARLRALVGGKHGSVAVAASALGISRLQVYRLMRKYNI